MISLTFSEFTTAILMVSIAFFSLLWLLEKPPSNNTINIDEKKIYRCQICGYTYFSKSIGRFSICPLCKSINVRDQN